MVILIFSLWELTLGQLFSYKKMQKIARKFFSISCADHSGSKQASNKRLLIEQT